jgi:phosphomannomutase
MSALIRVRLERPTARHRARFLAAVRRSRRLHSPWVSPPASTATYAAYLRRLGRLAHEQGRRVIRAPVGEVNVATRMRSENAPVGGEGNGGVILTEMHLGRDAPVGAAIILQLLLEEKKSLDEVQKLTDEFIHKLEAVALAKEQEILKV